VFIDWETVLGMALSCVQLGGGGGCDLVNGHNVLRKHLTCRSRKEFESSFHILHECDALTTLTYFFLGSGKLDSDNVRKTHPR
jgi:hypothetical protein